MSIFSTVCDDTVVSVVVVVASKVVAVVATGVGVIDSVVVLVELLR